MTEIRFGFNGQTYNPFFIEIEDCDGVELKTRKITFGPSTMKIIKRMVTDALDQHTQAKVIKEAQK